MFLKENALDLLSAALRHVRDAEHLAAKTHANSSRDQAFHLAGFGPECARKALLAVRWLDKAIGHGFEGLSENVIEVALALDPIAHRYHPTGWGTQYPTLTNWTEQSRYKPTNTYPEAVVCAITADARRAVDFVFGALWLDGRIPDGRLPHDI